ncbi:M91 family zinc metallopeptidase [Pseudomonas sp. 1152_12]|uniref:M91 family zinc metallopeptidase n=1 Tax=Pseudomonas sp. 1152_12 TaxID=2604455 RepID=UPI004062B87F
MGTLLSRIPLGASGPTAFAVTPETTSLSTSTPEVGLHTQTLFNEPTVLITREVETWRDSAGNYHSASMTHIITGDTADVIKITPHDNTTLTATINGKTYLFPMPENTDLHMINIETQGGNDAVVIGPGVKAAVRIMTGDGDDQVKTGPGYARVNGGSGNDIIRLGSGGGIALGGDGDDQMYAGAGDAVLSGGKGNDALYAGKGANRRLVYLNGGQGNDHLQAGGGTNVLNGGQGDDKLIGANKTTFYAGEGHDLIHSIGKKDRIYAKASDEIHHNEHSSITYMEVKDVGRKGIKIAGTPEFIDAAEDILDQLRSSPVGQQILEQMDRFVDAIRSPVTLRESADMNLSYYYFRNAYSDQLPASRHQSKPELGYIRNEEAGLVATHAEIELQTFHFGKKLSMTPLLALQHELAHAYNGATGTYQPGNQQAFGSDGNPVERYGMPAFVNNVEYQALGLAIVDGELFDYDNNPLTRPTTTNPAPFTENALRQEMGVRSRDRYLWDEAPRKV